MKKEQFNNHIKTINKLTELIRFGVMILVAISWFFLSNPKQDAIYLLAALFVVYTITSIQAINLKQKAVIRYMTDSISDNE